MLARTRKMANLVIEETSGVDHPAHLHEGWLVMKSADESEVQRVLDESLTEEDSHMEETTTTATDALEVEKAEMTLEDAMKKIAELEGKLSEMEMSKGEKESESEETEDEMDYMKSAPESVVKMIEDFKKQAETATEELRKEREAKADADAIEKAKGFSNLNLDAEKVGPALRRLSTVDADLAKSVEDILTSVNAQAESANIFAEIGKSADFTTGDAYGRLTAMAKSAVEEGNAKSFEQAFANAASSNPELYVQYRNEKGAN
jgi:myosin heavy subunit